MKKYAFSKEQKKEIIDMYCDKTIKVSEILDTYQISRNVLTRLLKEENVPFRLVKAAGQRTNIQLKKCDVCQQYIPVKDALYCPFCGHDIRTKSEKMLSKLTLLWEEIYNNFSDYEQKERAKKLFEDIEYYIKNN